MDSRKILHLNITLVPNLKTFKVAKSLFQYLLCLVGRSLHSAPLHSALSEDIRKRILKTFVSRKAVLLWVLEGCKEKVVFLIRIQN